MGSDLDFGILWVQALPALWRGLQMSLLVIVPSAIFGFAGGVVVGALRAFGLPFAQRIGNAYVALFRGVPLLLQLYFIYYALPKLGITLSPYQAATCGFVLCSAAYHSEYIRGALLSIHQGQIRAAQALGFSTYDTVVHIIIPQAIRRALPGCGNEIIYLIKYSSLAHVVSFVELTGEARQLADRSFQYIEIFLTLGLFYLTLTTLAAWFLRWVEKRSAIPGFGQA